MWVSIGVALAVSGWLGRTLYFSLSSVYCQWLFQCAFSMGVHTLGERCAHDHTAHAGGRGEVSLAALPPAGVQRGVDLGHPGGVGRLGGLSGMSAVSLESSLVVSRARSPKVRRSELSSVRQPRDVRALRWSWRAGEAAAGQPALDRGFARRSGVRPSADGKSEA